MEQPSVYLVVVAAFVVVVVMAFVVDVLVMVFMVEVVVGVIVLVGMPTCGAVQCPS